MDESLDAANDIDEGVAIFKERSIGIQPIANYIINKSAGNKELINDLLKSYIHLFMNRLFINNQRKYELVIYHFLERYYKSRMAIETSINNQSRTFDKFISYPVQK